MKREQAAMNALQTALKPAPSSSTLDVARIRADFPILQQEHHAGVPLVYLDNAATSQKPRLKSCAAPADKPRARA